MTVLMCPPTYYGIFYEINAWMNIAQKTQPLLASEQWLTLKNTIEHIGEDVLLIDGVGGLPDMVFTANAGLVYGKEVIISSFKEKERQPEAAHLQAWFIAHGFAVKTLAPVNDGSPPYFEGQGDALFAGKRLIGGYGFRSDKAAYDDPLLAQFNPLVCELVDPYFYHLDTCFCPLNDKEGFWYPQAFSKTSQTLLSQHFDLIAVAKEEAACFACNAIILKNKIILPIDCPQLTDKLALRGYEVHACEMSEYMKAGGACKCLVLCLS